MARRIQMSWFAQKDLDAGRKFKSEVSGLPANQGKFAGQIVGLVYDAQEKFSEINGQETRSVLLVGDFEAVRVIDKETSKSAQLYLPTYFADMVKAKLEKSGGRAVPIAVNVTLVATGKEIPVAWEVEPAIRREPTSPIEAMKRAMLEDAKNSGAEFLLPPPQDLPEENTLQIAHDPDTGEIVEEAEEDEEIPVSSEPPKTRAGAKAK